MLKVPPVRGSLASCANAGAARPSEAANKSSCEKRRMTVMGWPGTLAMSVRRKGDLRDRLVGAVAPRRKRHIH